MSSTSSNKIGVAHEYGYGRPLLRQRMIEDMNARKLCAGTQRGHIHSCKRFAAFLTRSPDTATAEDIRRFLSCLFRGLFLAKLVAAHRAGRLKFFGVHARLDNVEVLQVVSGTVARDRLGGLCQAAVRRPRGRARLSIALHPPGRHLQSPPDRGRPHRRHLPVEELPDRGAWPLSDHDAVSTHEFIRRFLMHVLPAACPHPALRTAGQWQPRRQHRAGARAARRAGPLRTAGCLRGPSGRQTPHVAATLPLLRRTHVHHRDLSRAAASQSARPTPALAAIEWTPHDAVIADPAPHRSAPFWPALARQHTGLRRSARLPRDRTANPVEQRAIRSFAPARTPRIRAKAIPSPASAYLSQHSRRRQIPIVPLHRRCPTPRDFSSSPASKAGCACSAH